MYYDRPSEKSPKASQAQRSRRPENKIKNKKRQEGREKRGVPKRRKELSSGALDREKLEVGKGDMDKANAIIHKSLQQKGKKLGKTRRCVN